MRQLNKTHYLSFKVIGQQSVICLALLLSVLLQYSCVTPEENWTIRDMEFEFQATTRGLNDTISIKDTVWFHLEIDRMGTDLLTGDTFDLF